MLGSAEPIPHAHGSGPAGARPQGPSGLTAAPPGLQASPGACASTMWTSAQAHPAGTAPSAWTGPTPTPACARRVRPDRGRVEGAEAAWASSRGGGPSGVRPAGWWVKAPHGLGPWPRARSQLSFDPGTGEGLSMQMNLVLPGGGTGTVGLVAESQGRGRSRAQEQPP